MVWAEKCWDREGRSSVADWLALDGMGTPRNSIASQNFITSSNQSRTLEIASDFAPEIPLEYKS